MSSYNVSAYGLACGHVQRVKIGADEIELLKEHGHFHVRRFSEFIDGRSRVKESWLVFETLKDARKAFKRQCEIARNVNFSA